jgi:leucyl aminopeptidase
MFATLALFAAACTPASQDSTDVLSTATREDADPVGAAAPAAKSTGLAPGLAAHEASGRVYLVSSRATANGLRGQVQPLAARRDATGAELVVSEADARQLHAVSEFVHRQERRCGGYFAFDTRAKAEAFVRTERSAQAIAAAVATYTLDNQRTVEHWLPQVQEARIKDTIRSLSGFQNRYYASATGRSSALWIHDHWRAIAAGRGDVTVELFTACASCSTQPSVILTIQGTSLRDEVVVLGAHLDSINASAGGSLSQLAPGADDDASGIAVLTETLRIALASGWRPRRTVKFMGYAAEEVGLRGSNAIAQAHRAAGTNVVAVLQVDMTNYKSGPVQDMRLMTDYSNTALKSFFLQLFDTYLAPRGYTRGLITCGYACSDHASWTNAGYPAAMMFEAGDLNGWYPYIHTTSDTLASMGDSAQHSVKFAQFSLAFLGEVAKSRVMRTGGPLPPQRVP